MDDDILRELRAADPARRVDLGRVDPRALDALRKEILVTSTEPDVGRGTVRRLSRRAVTAGVAVVAVLGGGVAYAAVEQGWNIGGGGPGILCVTRWADPTTEVLDGTGGSALSGDPVADCQEYQAQSGRPPIDDGVAFLYGSAQIYVAPRDQVPAGATVLTHSAQDEAEYELWESVYDLVDGLGASCLSGDDAVVAAQDELTRLGLTDWEVRTRQVPAGGSTGPCASTLLGQDLDLGPQTLIVTPGAREERDSLNGNGVDPLVFELRDALRAGITDRCVDVTEAEAVVTAAGGGVHDWPTTVVVDEAAACTRVDLLPPGGGDAQVTLRGPERVTP